MKGEVDIKAHFSELKRASAIKSIKGLRKGAAAAILLNDKEYKSMKSLPFAKDFKLLLASDPLPGVPLVVLGSRKDLVKTFRARVEDICKGAASTCQSIEVSKLRSASDKTYGDLIRRYEK